MPIGILQYLGITPEILFIVIMGFFILSALSSKLRQIQKGREPGNILEFFPDGYTKNGEPFLVCPVCHGCVLVPTHNENLAFKKVRNHIKKIHPALSENKRTLLIKNMEDRVEKNTFPSQ